MDGEGAGQGSGGHFGATAVPQGSGSGVLSGKGLPARNGYFGLGHVGALEASLPELIHRRAPGLVREIKKVYRGRGQGQGHFSPMGHTFQTPVISSNAVLPAWPGAGRGRTSLGG